MSEYKPIPWLEAKRIAKEFDKNQVIIVTWDNAHQLIHVATYGKSREDSAKAAQGGNFVKEALGWPDELCHDTPDWWKDGVKEIGNLADTADNLLGAAKLPVSDRIHLEGLKDGLKKIAAKLKFLYVELSGVNPWEEK